MDENSLNDCNKILGELARVDNDPVFGSNSNVLKTHLKQLESLRSDNREREIELAHLREENDSVWRENRELTSKVGGAEAESISLRARVAQLEVVERGYPAMAADCKKAMSERDKLYLDLSSERNSFSEILGSKNMEISQLKSTIGNLNDYKVLYDTLKLNDSQYHTEISILTANYQQEINDLQRIENDHLMTINNMRNDIALAESEKERILFSNNEMYEEIGYLKEANSNMTKEFEILKKNFEDLSRRSIDQAKAAKVEHEKSADAHRELIEQLYEYKEGLGKFNNLNNIIDFLQLELADISSVDANRNCFDMEAYRSDLRALARKLSRVITDNNSSVNANIRLKRSKSIVKTSTGTELKSKSSKSPIRGSIKKAATVKSPAVKPREEAMLYYSVPGNLKSVIQFICRVIEQISHFQEDLVLANKRLGEQSVSIAGASELVQALEKRLHSSRQELHRVDGYVGNCSSRIVELINTVSSFVSSSGSGSGSGSGGGNETGGAVFMDTTTFSASASLDTIEQNNVSTMNNVSAINNALFTENELFESTFNVPVDGNLSGNVLYYSKADSTNKLKTNINFLEIQISSLFAEIEKLKKSESLLSKKAILNEKSISDVNRVYELQQMECKRLYDLEIEKLLENFSIQMHNLKEKLQVSEANSRRIETEKNNDIRFEKMHAEAELNERLKEYIVRISGSEEELCRLHDRIGDLSLCVEHLTSHSLRQGARLDNLLEQKRLLTNLCSRYTSTVGAVKDIARHISSDGAAYNTRDRSSTSDRRLYKMKSVALHFIAAMRLAKLLAVRRRQPSRPTYANPDNDDDDSARECIPRLFHQEFDTSFSGEDSWSLPRRKDLAKVKGDASAVAKLIFYCAKASSAYYRTQYDSGSSGGAYTNSTHNRSSRNASARPTAERVKKSTMNTISFFGDAEVTKVAATMDQMNTMISTLSQQLKYLTEKDMEMSAYLANQTALRQEQRHALSGAHRAMADEERRLREKMEELHVIEMEHLHNLQSLRYHRTSTPNSAADTDAPGPGGRGGSGSNSRGAKTPSGDVNRSSNKLSYEFEEDNSPTSRGSHYNDLYLNSSVRDGELQQLLSDCNFLTKNLRRDNSNL